MASNNLGHLLYCLVLVAACRDVCCRKDVLNIRLVNHDKNVENEGFVEYFSKGVWRKISNGRWDYRNDLVVCKQLGFADVGKKPQLVPKYRWKRHFIFKHFFCQGAERTISDCDKVDMEFTKRRTIAKPGNEAWVSCANQLDATVTTPTASSSSGLVKDIQVRLVNTARDHNKPTPLGVLEVNVHGKWQQVCADGWTNANSHVACGHLGYSRAVESVAHASYEMSRHHVMKSVVCKGNELSLLSCEHAGFAKHYGCKKSVVLHCESIHVNNEDNPTIRLRGGQLPSEGRVEIFRGGAWGTVCHDGWDINDANVVCKQLGFGTAKEAVRSAELGQGAIRMSMTDVACDGTEASLTDCRFDNPKNTCNHFKDAGVRCNYPVPQSRKVRLVGGENRFEGRVEVRHLGRWYSICGLQFTELDGEVVCRELGLGFIGKTFSSWEYGISTIGIYELGCSGNEPSILKCSHRPWFHGSCRYYDMAVVKCANYAPDILMDLNAMRSSIKINTWPLHHLSCSKSENCLTSTAYTKDAYVNPKTKTRRLMVFTSLILNKGTAAFRPNRHKDQWEWHQCHKHFHSMEYFSRYDVIDIHGRRVAEGHKASFCLEDSECESGLKKMYNCTDKGDQGISVGCADNYASSIDCQWVDVTDIEDGNYTLMVHLNPSRRIVESDYSNNIASCEVHYHNSSVVVGKCFDEPCEQRSYGGNGYGTCCQFPFLHNGVEYHSCLSNSKESPWCATTYDYDSDRQWGFCRELI